jgi:hypothetical protein
VVIDDFDVIRSILLPYKANAELIVDANAVLPFPFSLQRFEHIPRRFAEIVKPGGRIHPVELSPSYGFNGAPSPVCAQLGQFRRVAVLETSDHGQIIDCNAFNVKR